MELINEGENTFKVVEGIKVYVSGSVVIDHVIHKVESGFIKCDSSLNSRAWNTTNEKMKCARCYPMNSYFLPGQQLDIFDLGA